MAETTDAAEKTGFVEGFKKFIMRGNAVDLAVGMVIGAAFTGVVGALVEKIINPLIAMPFGKPDFGEAWSFTYNGSTVALGALITALINFLLVALALYVFIIIPMNKLAEIQAAKKAKEAEEEEETPADIELLQEIRDLLAKQKA
ncbi:MAG: large conductance mechanosensitive channel protein MscL [Actinomycetaceae bacterium]|nr:large conductance mechanosensitive channel protein MscL [Actinomycetaceae bacterium]